MIIQVFISGSRTADRREGQMLVTKLSPLPGEKEDGVKACFCEKKATPWRVIMIGNHPGKFIESELVYSLNPPCALDDTSWIKTWNVRLGSLVEW